MPTTSLCMVVKDEERTLAAAVGSVRDLVDEVVIGVDDSCTDQTPLIAAQLASPGKLFSFTWDNDFSRVRNEAIARADGNLILILDGHECIAPDEHPTPGQMARMRHVDIGSVDLLTPRSMLAYVRAHDIGENTDVICGTVAMNTDVYGIPQLFFLQPRILRNNGEIHYAGAVHNALSGQRSDRTGGAPELILLHNMPQEREEKRQVQRRAMNVSGLYADVKRERRKPFAEQNGRPWFYMGNTYADQGMHDKAIWWYQQYLDRSKFGDEKFQAHQQLAIILFRHRKDHAAAKEHAIRAMVLNHSRAEPLILLGEIAHEQKQYEEAIHWFELASQVAAPVTVMFLQGAAYSYMPAVRSMICHEAMEHWHAAMEAAELALTWRPGDPSVVERIAGYRNKLRTDAAAPNLLFVDSIGSFSGTIAQRLAKQPYTVVARQQCDARWKAWADLAWFEWCDQNLIEWSRWKWECPVVCRLHSYEAFSNQPAQVDWSQVAHLIFVAPHIRELFKQRWPQVLSQTPHSIIPNGVEVERFRFRKRGPGRRIAYLGYFNHKKGTEILLQAILALPDYEFHLGGDFQDPHLHYYFQHTVAGLPNVFYYGRVQDVDDWLEDMDYLISPSIVESFGFSIAEAMCKGIKPLIHDRPGAIWSETWRGVGDLRRLLEGPYESEAYRQHIADRFHMDKVMEQIEGLLQALLHRPRPERDPIVPVQLAQACLGSPTLIDAPQEG